MAQNKVYQYQNSLNSIFLHFTHMFSMSSIKFNLFPIASMSKQSLDWVPCYFPQNLMDVFFQLNSAVWNRVSVHSFLSIPSISMNWEMWGLMMVWEGKGNQWKVLLEKLQHLSTSMWWWWWWWWWWNHHSCNGKFLAGQITIGHEERAYH